MPVLRMVHGLCLQAVTIKSEFCKEVRGIWSDHRWMSASHHAGALGDVIYAERATIAAGCRVKPEPASSRRRRRRDYHRSTHHLLRRPGPVQTCPMVSGGRPAMSAWQATLHVKIPGISAAHVVSVTAQNLRSMQSIRPGAHHSRWRPGCCCETDGSWSNTDVGEPRRFALNTGSPGCPPSLSLQPKSGSRPLLELTAEGVLQRLAMFWQHGHQIAASVFPGGADVFSVMRRLGRAGGGQTQKLAT